MLVYFNNTQNYKDHKNDHSSIYRYMLINFHSVFWHSVDVVVILLITASMPFHCPCLQYHFLYLPLRARQRGGRNILSIGNLVNKFFDKILHELRIDIL